MELSQDLKDLYKHWPDHTHTPIPTPIPIPISNLDLGILEKIVAFINERMRIYDKKEKGIEPPYSDDKILATYRFCNIYRELDRQTIFFHKLLKPYEKDFPLWLLNMLFCRSICSTETVEKVGLLSFDSQNNETVFERLLSLQSPKYGTAYIFPISTIMKSEWNTREKLFCLYYPMIIKEIASEIEIFNKTSVIDALPRILPLLGFNLKFLTTELLIDVAYQYPEYINLFGSFPIGPGSLSTMKMLCKNQEPSKTNLSLVSYTPGGINYLTYNGKNIHLSAENWEGIGCEFRKYTNLSNGRGRRRLYIQK